MSAIHLLKAEKKGLFWKTNYNFFNKLICDGRQYIKGIIERLEEFGKKRCVGPNWKKSFAELLNISSKHLDKILSGHAELGDIIEHRLRKIGGDAEYVLTGVNAKKKEPFRIHVSPGGWFEGKAAKEKVREIFKGKPLDTLPAEIRAILMETITDDDSDTIIN